MQVVSTKTKHTFQTLQKRLIAKAMLKKLKFGRDHSNKNCMNDMKTAIHRLMANPIHKKRK